MKLVQLAVKLWGCWTLASRIRPAISHYGISKEINKRMVNLITLTINSKNYLTIRRGNLQAVLVCIHRVKPSQLQMGQFLHTAAERE